jgi:hypothetical protein
MSHSINPIVHNIADSSPNIATDNIAMSHSINPTVDNITHAIPATGIAPATLETHGRGQAALDTSRRDQGARRFAEKAVDDESMGLLCAV